MASDIYANVKLVWFQIYMLEDGRLRQLYDNVHGVSTGAVRVPSSGVSGTLPCTYLEVFAHLRVNVCAFSTHTHTHTYTCIHTYMIHARGHDCYRRSSFSVSATHMYTCVCMYAVHVSMHGCVCKYASYIYANALKSLRVGRPCGAAASLSLPVYTNIHMD